MIILTLLSVHMHIATGVHVIAMTIKTLQVNPIKQYNLVYKSHRNARVLSLFFS